MGIIELIIISISLAMDAFSASICKGLNETRINLKNSLIVAFYFGLFQTIMPAIGYYLGSFFSDKISAIDHYLAFILLSFIGITMIKENNENNNQNINFKEMLILAIATSIDALIVGVTFSFLKVKLFLSIIIIGIITFILTFIGYNIGLYFGIKYRRKAQIIGGIILIIMGLKILLEHLF